MANIDANCKIQSVAEKKADKNESDKNISAETNKSETSKNCFEECSSILPKKDESLDFDIFDDNIQYSLDEHYLLFENLNVNTKKSDTTVFEDEKYILSGTESDELIKVSSAPSIGIIGGRIIDSFDGETKDGTVTDTKQHATGDCWLLSGINSLNYTEKGREIIKDSLEYHDDYTVVHLAFGDYVVKDSDVVTTKGSLQYASGDDDMIILELAIEQLLDEIATGEIQLTEDAPWYLTQDTDKNGNHEKTSLWNSSIDDGWSSELWYLMTGKTSDAFPSTKESLDEFQNSNGDIAMACGISSFDNKDVEGLGPCLGHHAYIKDLNGKKHLIAAPHAYAVKNVTEDNVTVINPWNSANEIVLSREQYLSLFDVTEKIDLSDNNPQQKYFTFNVTDENGKIQNYENRQIKYNENGEVECITYDKKDNNGNSIIAYDINNDGVIDKYSQNGEYAAAPDENENNIDDANAEIQEEDKEIVDKEEVSGKFNFFAPKSEEFECSEILTLKDKNTGEITKQFYDKQGNLRHESLCDKDGKILSEISYEREGKLKIEAQYGMLGDEDGEYYGIERYVIEDIDYNGKMKNQFPLAKTEYQNIEKRHLLDYSQFDGAQIGFLARINNEDWKTVEKYLKENPNATYREIASLLYN